MGLLLPSIMLAVGFVIIIWGADYLVRGASSLAKRLSVSEIAVGLTVVAFGTSMPELVVNIFSSMGGHNEIVFGNIIGSNMFNIFVILGAAGMIHSIDVQKNTVWKEIPLSLFAALLLLALVRDSTLSQTDGVVFLGFFVIFLIYVYSISKATPVESKESEVKVYSLLKTTLFVLAGLAGLFMGGDMVVENAVLIARELSVSEKLIALTIVAAGTSLPELATSTVAAYRKRYDIAVGNIIGSSIFNIFLILGVSALIRPAHYDAVFNTDICVLVFSTLLLFASVFVGKVRYRLDKRGASAFLATYAAYLAYLLYRR